MKNKCTILLVSNKPKKKNCELECSVSIANGILSVIVVLLVFGVTMWYSGQQEVVESRITLNDLQSQYATLESEKAEGDKLIASLSEMVNVKVIEDAAREQAILDGSIPIGFPLNGTATIEDYQATDRTVFQVNNGVGIIASGSGEVSYVGEDEEYGYQVRITHQEGYVSIYRVNESATVSEGQEVTRGTILFVMDETGSFAYEILHNDQVINPLEIMDISG